jgi:hypothetical protein
MRRRYYPPTPSVAEPRSHLLGAAREFVRSVSGLPGVLRVALIGSLTTSKAIPKDADLLVTINPTMDLDQLARAGRRLKGQTQSINLGADIFLADANGTYLGRICGYRECHARARCQARHCGQRQHLNDDLDIVTLARPLIETPPLELWPNIVRRCTLPADVENMVISRAGA